MNDEKFLLCWSHRQNGFHVESETTSLQINQQAFTDNKPLDHIPIGIFESQQEAVTAADKLTSILRKRDGN